MPSHTRLDTDCMRMHCTDYTIRFDVPCVPIDPVSETTKRDWRDVSDLSDAELPVHRLPSLSFELEA